MEVRVLLGSDGSISVAGPADRAWVLRVLVAARDTIVARRARLGLAPPVGRADFAPTTDADPRVIVTVAEIRLVVGLDGSLSIHGPVDDSAWMIALLDHGIDAFEKPLRRQDVAMPAHRPRADVGGSTLVGGVAGVVCESFPAFEDCA